MLLLITSIIAAVLVRAHPYLAVIFESGNIRLNRGQHFRLYYTVISARFSKKSINSWRIRSCFCSGAMFIRYNVSQDVISSAIFHGNIRNTRGAECMIFTLCWFFNTRPFFVLFVPVFLRIFVLFLRLTSCSVRRRHFVSPAVSELAATATTAVVAMGIAKGSLCFNACRRADKAAAVAVVASSDTAIQCQKKCKYGCAEDETAVRTTLYAHPWLQ